MSRRDDILLALRQAYGTGLDGLTPEQLADAYRTEVLAEAKVETVAWLVKKAREYRATGSSQHVRQAEAVEFLASKVDRGAVRAFLGTAHYRDALDAHRAEVLTELAAEAERRLAAGKSRTVSKDAVLRFLNLEASVARATTGKSSPTGADATPDFFQAGHTYVDPDHGTDWKFRVDTVTTHPEDGERTALGWRHFRGEWEPYAYGEDDYEIHLLAGTADVTEDGGR